MSNTVTNKDCDIDHFVENVTEKIKNGHKHKNHEEEANVGDMELADIFAPLEILNCQSMLDYLLNSPNILSKLLIE